jgi:putative tricarboxylic transport membrane protein
MFDLWVMLGAGAIGYILKRYGFSPTPLVIGLVLGSMLESNLVQSLIITGGSVLALWERPIAGTVLSLTGIALVLPFILNLIFQKQIPALASEE